LLLIAPGENRILADGGMAGEERPHAGPLAANPSERAGIADGVRAATAVFLRYGHTENVVFAPQRENLIVEAMLDVAQFLNGPNLLAKGLHIGEQLLLIHRSHGVLLCTGRPREPSGATNAARLAGLRMPLDSRHLPKLCRSARGTYW